MRFTRQRTEVTTDDAADADEIVQEVGAGRAYTPGKGRPTPKRRDAQGGRRGPVPPPPKTQREAMKRSRLTKESKVDRRSAAAERRERMAAGDDKYLLPRDKGPVRAHVRDIVDSRRHLIGLFMPLAVVVLIATVAPLPAIQLYAAPATMVVLLMMIVEGVLLGRSVVKRVRVKFPEATDRSLALGWYSFVRASQVRKLRIPKPKVRPGDTV